MANVNIRDLVKSYHRPQVIHGVNIDISDGEFVVLVGPSGCGKSTLLRMIAGLEEVSNGEIHIGTRLVNAVSAKDRDIAMVFQSYALYPHMTVAQNMGFALKLRGESRAAIRAKVDDAAAILNLSHLLDRLPRQLSGGQRQRVAMGRAIVRQPQVFLFDEPLSNLDAQLRVSMRSEIKSLHQRLGTTIVYVTHDQIEAMTLADKIVVMRDGYVEQIGTPLELYDRPRNRFVAGFIGSPGMNFLETRIVGDGVMLGSHEVGIPANLPSGPARAVTCGLRPEHVTPVSEGGLPFLVEVVEPTGAETLVLGRVDGQQATFAFRDRVAPSPGSVMRLTVQPGALHVFDQQSEQRLN